jgi:hypothetical protein
MPPAEIEARLGERFRLLSAGSRRSVDRHRTLLAAVSWSHDLLSDHEKLVFRRLAAFPSTFDLAAAEQVAGEVDVDVLDSIVRLVDRSLVVYEPGAGRYRLLETLRQYAADRLAESGETDSAQERHVQYFSQLVQRLSPQLEDQRYEAALAVLTTELDNLRAMVEWHSEQERWDELGKMVLGLWQFVFQGGPAVGRDWFGRLLAHEDELDHQVLVDLLAQSVWAYYSHGIDAALASLNAERSIGVADEHGLGQSPWAWATKASVALMNPSPDALADYRRGLAAAEARHDEIAAIVITGFLGIAHGALGETQAATDSLEGSLRHAEQFGHPVGIQAAVLVAVSRYLYMREVPDLAASLRVLTRYAPRIDDAMAMYSDALLGATLVALGRAGAIEHLTRAARLADRRGSVAGTDVALTFLAIAAGQRGYGAAAATLAGYAGAHPATNLLLHSTATPWVTAMLDDALSQVPDRDVHEAAGAAETRGPIMELVTQLETELDDR